MKTVVALGLLCLAAGCSDDSTTAGDAAAVEAAVGEDTSTTTPAPDVGSPDVLPDAGDAGTADSGDSSSPDAADAFGLFAADVGTSDAAEEFSPDSGHLSGPDAGDASRDAADATGPDAGDATVHDAGDASRDAADATAEAGVVDGGSKDACEALDGGPCGAFDAEPADAACPTSWSAAPKVAAAISIPPDAGALPVLLHAAGVGTQNYSCEEQADGGAAWTFVGPEANLENCHGADIGTHFASVAEANPPPEWMLEDGGFVVGTKVAAYTPDGGEPAVPWLLLRVSSQSDAGTFAEAKYVQRLNTVGGLQPSGPCTPDGGVDKVPYTADYYFFGP